ncbi:MAG: hypothetical protein LBP34_01565 [Flavobacteriaceae bacterium]|jgi:hypothetical protein|nr:hypothetical protein [Flavobacteriaceae bacterium]
MIKKYSHTHIDKEKYTYCLQQSINYRIYAELWYLDIVSPEGYDVLVLNDYQAVMPIPYRKKLGLKFVSQPVFCQQLGIFYKEKISTENFNLFFSSLKKYRVRAYCFNEENTGFFPPEQRRRNNQILYLNLPYDKIFKNFNSNRKREIKKISDETLSIEKQISFNEIDRLFKDQDFYAQHQSDKIQQILNKNHEKKVIEQVSLIKENKIIAHITFLVSKDRLISILPLRDKSFGMKGSISYLLNHIINEYSDSGKIVDFEGSMLPGVADFNRSFGAVTKNYVEYKNFKWIELLKQSIVTIKAVMKIR